MGHIMPGSEVLGLHHAERHIPGIQGGTSLLSQTFSDPSLTVLPCVLTHGDSAALPYLCRLIV